MSLSTPVAPGAPAGGIHLLQLMQTVARADTLGEIHQSALGCLHATLGVNRSSLLVFDEHDVMRFAAWEGLSETYRRQVEGHTPWSPEDADATPILVPDVRRDPSLTECQEVFERERIAALAFIPVVFGSRVLGKFMLYYERPHTFTDAEVSNACLVAGHVAFALEHQRVTTDLERRLVAESEARAAAEREIALRQEVERRKSLLLRASEALSRSLVLDETFEALSELVVPEFADWYVVHLLDEDGRILPAHIGHTDPQRCARAREAAQRRPARVDLPVTAHAAIHYGRSTLIEEVTPEVLAAIVRDPKQLELALELGLCSAMIVPLRLPNRAIGSMMFVQAESRRTYALRDLAVAEALADQTALSIDNARLYQAAQEARARAEDVARRLDVLASASTLIGPSLEPEAALEQLAKLVVSTLADYCIVYRLAPDGLIHRVGLAHADPAQQALVFELGRLAPLTLDDEFGPGKVLRTGEPILAPSIEPDELRDSAQSPEHLAVLLQLAPRSTLIIPLVARGRTLGAVALAATDRSGRHYGEGDLNLARVLAHRAALLVDNARLYVEARDATHARDEMLAIVSHDLRAPLSAVSSACDLLGLDPSPEHTAILAGVIRRATGQMSRLIEDLLEVSRIHQGRLTVEPAPVDVATLVTSALSLHAPVAEQRAIRLEHAPVDAPVHIRCDRTRVIQALGNILGNALKFTPEGGKVEVRVGVEEDRVCIRVADTGPGIPDDQLAHLFDRFWRGGRENRDGIGLGLTIAKGIAEAHGGRIEVTSQLGEGSVFTLVLPR